MSGGAYPNIMLGIRIARRIFKGEGGEAVLEAESSSHDVTLTKAVEGVTS